MAGYIVKLRTNDRDRIERRIQNSIIAHATVAYSGGIFQPKDEPSRAKQIARLVCEDLLKDYRLVPRK